MQNYKDLKVWEKAHHLVLLVYAKTQNFPKEETFGLTGQLRRASASIPTNIAEGTGRFTQKDFASFLQNALGSSQEVEYLLLLAKELRYLPEEDFKICDKEIGEIKATLISLIKKVRL